ncbi:MAG: hypothetical protein WAK60_10925 [Sedimentisphaerales bacterium]
MSLFGLSASKKSVMASGCKKNAVRQMGHLGKMTVNNIKKEKSGLKKWPALLPAANRGFPYTILRISPICMLEQLMLNLINVKRVKRMNPLVGFKMKG